jgi:hypothetical protein
MTNSTLRIGIALAIALGAIGAAAAGQPSELRRSGSYDDVWFV